uniref:Uncharacterized protein n=1 Tax=Kalanchoe fedtschenkoi TaxID=63787 RepID=A0A7N0USV6_KALFE
MCVSAALVNEQALFHGCSESPQLLPIFGCITLNDLLENSFCINGLLPFPASLTEYGF